MRNLFLLVLFVFSNVAFSQSYVVQNVVELSNDLTARRNAVKDSNGSECALVRVNIPSVNGILFNSTIVGTPQFLPGEYNVYIPKTCSVLSFVVDGQTFNIEFSKFNVTPEEKKCYRVILSKVQSNNSKKVNTKIVANYDNAVVMIDGIPVGQTPLLLDNVTPGKHVISVPNTIGVTMNDKTIDIKDNSTITLSLHKEAKKTVMVDMATPGGDTAGWYNIFGTNVTKKNGKMGIVDYAGNVIVPCEYDNIYPGIQNGYYVVTNNGKDGLYEPGKGLVVPCIYDGIVTNKSYSPISYMPMCIDKKWGVMSPSGQVIVPIEYENYPHRYEDVIRVQYKKPGYKAAYGLYAYNGNQIVSPKYDCLNDFVNGYAFFLKFDKSVGFVDKNGNETFIPTNLSIGNSWGNGGTISMNGLFRVKDKNSKKWGYMDRNLNLVIPTIYDAMQEYDEAPNFNQGIVTLKHNGNKVIVNSKGNIILDISNCPYKDFKVVCQSDYSWNKGRFFTYHDSDGIVDNTFILVKNDNNLCGLLDVDGNIVVPCKYEENDIQWFTYDDKNYFVLTEKDQLVVKDQKQNVLFSLPSNLVISEITDGFIMIRDQETNSYGYLNMKGEILANCIYGYESDESEGSEVDNSGESEEGYDITSIIDEQPISEGLAILNVGDRFGFIDNKGIVKVPLKYTAVTPFENGISYVRQTDGKWKKINIKDL